MNPDDINDFVESEIASVDKEWAAKQIVDEIEAAHQIGIPINMMPVGRVFSDWHTVNDPDTSTLMLIAFENQHCHSHCGCSQYTGRNGWDIRDQTISFLGGLFG